MQVRETAPHTIAEVVQEGHLRLAVLLDLIDDELSAHVPLAPRLAQLRVEYDRHALRQEEILALRQPVLLESHRRTHDHMRALLGRLSDEHDGGGDVRAMLDQVVGLFTGRLMPEDAVFRAMTDAAPV